MASDIPAGWYQDPAEHQRLRFWDGASWTQHVTELPREHSDTTETRTASETPQSLAIRGGDQARATKPARSSNGHQLGPTNPKVIRQIRKARIRKPKWRGNGTIYSEPVLVVNQKAKWREIRAEYTIYNQFGQELGKAREIGWNYFKEKFSLRTGNARKMTLEVRDNRGAIKLVLIRTSTGAGLRPTIDLIHSNGKLIGTIREQSVFRSMYGKIDLMLDDEPIGVIHLGIYEFESSVRDASGRTVALISRTWKGRFREARTKADNYVLQILEPTTDHPLTYFMVVSPLIVDILMRQDVPSKEAAKWERRHKHPPIW